MWLIRELIGVIKQNNIVIANNTAAIVAVEKNSAEILKISIGLKDELNRRPCIAHLAVKKES